MYSGGDSGLMVAPNPAPTPANPTNSANSVYYTERVMRGSSGWMEDMHRLKYLVKTTSGGWEVDQDVSGYGNKSGNSDKRDDMVMKTITRFAFEFAYNKNDESDIYWRRRRTDGSGMKDCTEPFRKFPYSNKQLKNEVVHCYETLFKKTPDREIKACLNNIMNNITKEADLENGLWYASKGLFWDSANAKLISDEELNGRASFREIGCSSRDDAVSAERIKNSYDRWTSLLNKMTEEYGEFENFYKELPIEHDHFKLWACVDSEGQSGVDKYWDMCIATSTVFMYLPPPIAYIPKGKPRGGKSSFIKHLHYLIGDWQTSGVMMSQLSDYHFNNTLYGSLLNAPDEDKSGDLNDENTAIFKSLAAKEKCGLSVMYSNKPKQIVFKSMMFFPRNALPDFGRESAACMKRLRFIFCNADLSEFDKRPVDFLKVTFKDRPDYTADYLGFILALSGYFQEHGMWYSQTMQDSSDYVAESVNSTAIYYKTWKKYFLGFSSFSVLWADYKNFCFQRGYKLETKEVLKDLFAVEGSNRCKKYYPNLKRDIWMCLTNKQRYGASLINSGYHILCAEEYYEGYGTVQDRVMEGESSVVDMLDELTRSKEESFIGKKQSRLGGR